MRNILIHFAIKYNGDFIKILSAIKEKETVTKEDIEKVKNLNINALTCLDDNYPVCLREIYAPPFVLFYKGDISLLNSDMISVIGSREPTSYGIEVTEKILNELFDIKDVTIVSGLAKGIDAVAHKTALDNNQKTIAVLGSGVDVCYPKENFILFKKIEERGLLLSEYPMGCKPDKKNFPLRNRIIAALGKGILVTDATCPSGTQNTVRNGLEMNKDIMAVPHSVLENSYCNFLLRQGAIPILSGKDIVDEIF